MSPFTKADLQLRLERVKANLRTLDACPGPHEFIDDPNDERSFSRGQRCARCGGEVEFLAALWYRRGLEHGKKAGP